ncbi:Uncharacterised protein [uncultured archaeon]|nr:Uncharacterised protein [uncultured archaeon]
MEETLAFQAAFPAGVNASTLPFTATKSLPSPDAIETGAFFRSTVTVPLPDAIETKCSLPLEVATATVEASSTCGSSHISSPVS